MIRSIKVQLKENRCLHLHRELLCYLGLWPPIQETSRPILLLNAYLPRTALLSCAWFGMTYYLIGVFTLEDDLTGRFSCIFLTSGNMLGLFKAGSLIFKHDTFKSLVDSLERVHDRYRPRSKRGHAICDKTQMLTNFTVVLTLLLILVLVIFVLIPLPFLMNARKLYYPGWAPYNMKTSPNYEFTLLLNIINTLFGTPWILSVDLFIAAIFVQIIGQFKLLRFNLSNIRHQALQTVRMRHAGGTVGAGRRKHTRGSTRANELKCSTETAESWRHQRLDRKPHWDGYSTLLGVPSDQLEQILEMEHVASTSTCNPEQQVIDERDLIEIEDTISPNQMDDIGMEYISLTNQEVDTEMELLLRDCIIHHVKLCRLTGEFEAAFSVILIIQLLCNVTSIIAFVIWITMMEAMDLSGFGLILMIEVFAAELFLICLFSNQISDESSRIREAVYSMDWFDASESFKKAMRVMMSRANQPVVVMVAGYIPLSMETFYSVMQMAHGLYSTIEEKLKND